ncbi:rhomboid family intramembrane serine protease [Ravibacter arvi]|uniref:Rhomboid family intramembrane serine protease n=1 Tax=Ravibacter arvi TaxID=2051041 RepID=A0ABP8LXZ6_9BACT
MSITLILIIVTIAISWYSWSNPSLLDKLLLNPVRVTRHKEYYRFLTSGFVHADFGHLLFNMLSFWFIGEGVEALFRYLFGAQGGLYFLALYLLGIVVSDVPSFLKNRTNSRYNSLGASGGVAAVIFAAILYAPLMDVYLYFAIKMPGFIFGILFLGYSIWQSKKGGGYVNHDAHMFGALFGMVFMALVYPEAVPNFFKQLAGWRLF